MVVTAVRTVHTPTPAQMAMLAKAKGRLMQISITITDYLTAAAGSIAGNWEGLPRYGADSGILEEALRKWAAGKGYSKCPPVHKYINEEYFTRREQYGLWPEKKNEEYRSHFPVQLEQYTYLAQAIDKLKPGTTGPQMLITGGFAKARPSAVIPGQWDVNLAIGAYFSSFPRQGTHNPGIGVDYVWIHEFGLYGFPERSFIQPALERAALEWQLNWETEVESAKYILENADKLGQPPIISGNDPLRPSTLSSIVHHFPERHLNWLSMLLWLLPVNKYISILAAIKDVKGMVFGSRLKAGSIRTWLQSQAMGGLGATVKSQRKAFRKKLWGD